MKRRIRASVSSSSSSTAPSRSSSRKKLRATPEPTSSTKAAATTNRKTGEPSTNSTQVIGRETEISTVQEFLRGCIEGNHGGALYACGSTGTGKTASVSLVVESLQSELSSKRSSKKSSPSSNVRWLTLNGNTFNQPEQVFSAMYSGFLSTSKGASGSVVETDWARKELEKAFRCKRTKSGAKRKGEKVYVAVIDEIDQLLKQREQEQVLYEIFAWAMQTDSMLCLIGIANAIDMRERFLPRLERLGFVPQVLVYSAYTMEELKEILAVKLQVEEERSNVKFESVAIEFCARKIAAKSGDLRKGLDLCRRAILLAKKQSPQENAVVPVTLVHMSKVMRTVFESPYVQIIQTLPQQAQYGVVAIARYCRKKTKALEQELDKEDAIKCNKKAKKEGVVAVHETKLRVQDLFTEYRRMMLDWHLPSVTMSEFTGTVLDQLQQNGLVVVSQTPGKNKGGKEKLVKVCVKLEDIDFALKDNVAFRQLLSGKANREYGANIYATA